MPDIDLGGPNSGGSWLNRAKNRAEKKRGVMYEVTEPRVVEPTEKMAVRDRGRVELGACFKNAANYLVEHDLADARLVHGTVSILQAKSADGAGVPIDHAWVECGGVVYDGVQRQFYDKADYYEKMRAAARRAYSREDALVNMLKHKHFGPWER